MSITGVGSSIAASVQALASMEKQLDDLSRQLGTGQKAAVYSDLGLQAGVTVGLDAQLAAIDGYGNTITTVGTTLSIAQTALSQIASVGSSVQQKVNTQGAFTLDNNGQTTTQEAAATQLDQVLDLLNTRSGDNYLFSGSAVNQGPVDTAAHILNGNGAQAGLKQLISEHSQADLGASGLGRLAIPVPAPLSTTVSVSEDGSPFGFKLGGVGSTLTGAVVSGPAGSPPSISINLASNPNPGDSIQFSLTLPDGSSESVTLEATTASPPGANQFTIGPTPDVTADHLQGALTTVVSNLAQTALPAASAVAAADNFFGSNPPQRVVGPPFDTAMTLQNATSADTVFWYKGEAGGTSARATALAQVGPSTTISYGMRANEQAISSLVANIAALAATSYSPTDPNAAASYAALGQRVGSNLSGQPGAQSVQDIEADIANAQVAADNAKTVNQQTKTTLADMLQHIEGVSTDQIGAQILALQTSLQASLSTTARLAQLSLVNYLK
jgi:flagellar hook-associated protein 3 FlgL